MSDSLPGVTVFELPCLEIPFVRVEDWGVRGPPLPPEEVEAGRPPECFRLATERKIEKACLNTNINTSIIFLFQRNIVITRLFSVHMCPEWELTGKLCKIGVHPVISGLALAFRKSGHLSLIHSCEIFPRFTFVESSDSGSYTLDSKFVITQ